MALTTCPHCGHGHVCHTGQISVPSDWLRETLERARIDYESLPEWARPVVVPSIVEGF